MIDVSEPAAHVEFTMRVGAVERLSSRLTWLRVEPGRPFPFTAGQAVMAGLATQDIRKPYSIASSPASVREAGGFDLLIGHDEPGILGPHLTPVATGSILGVSGPMGRFGLPSRLAGRPLLFVAGGTGIAPLRSMLGEALLRLPPPDLALVYSARTVADLAFHGQFVSLRDAGRLTYTPTVTREMGAGWTGRRGRIDDDVLGQLIRPETVCVVCGSQPFNADLTTALTRLGVRASRILTERY